MFACGWVDGCTLCEAVYEAWYAACKPHTQRCHALPLCTPPRHLIVRDVALLRAPGSRKGVHEVAWLGDARVILINTEMAKSLVALKPKGVNPFSSRDFASAKPPHRVSRAVAQGMTPAPPGESAGSAAAEGPAVTAVVAGRKRATPYTVVAGGPPGESCNDVCAQVVSARLSAGEPCRFRVDGVPCGGVLVADVNRR